MKTGEAQFRLQRNIKRETSGARILRRGIYCFKRPKLKRLVKEKWIDS